MGLSFRAINDTYRIEKSMNQNCLFHKIESMQIEPL